MATDFSRERDTERAEIPERAETQEALGSRLEGLVQQMQTPAARRARVAAFDASPDELGRTAVEQARAAELSPQQQELSTSKSAKAPEPGG